jgi:dolichol-phosphate mannosyltransferase
MDIQVLDILNAMPESNRYIRSLLAWVGFRQTSVLFEKNLLYTGDIKYTFDKCLSLADGIIYFSRVTLRLATFLGLLLAAITLRMILVMLYWQIFAPVSPLIGYTLIRCYVFLKGYTVNFYWYFG